MLNFLYIHEHVKRQGIPNKFNLEKLYLLWKCIKCNKNRRICGISAINVFRSLKLFAFILRRWVMKFVNLKWRYCKKYAVHRRP